MCTGKRQHQFLAVPDVNNHTRAVSFRWFALQEAVRQAVMFSAVFSFPFYLEAVERYKQSQDVIGTLKDSEDSQIPQYSFHTSILHQQNGVQWVWDYVKVPQK